MNKEQIESFQHGYLEAKQLVRYQLTQLLTLYSSNAALSNALRSYINELDNEMRNTLPLDEEDEEQGVLPFPDSSGAQ